MEYLFAFIAGVVSALVALRVRRGTNPVEEPADGLGLQDIAGPSSDGTTGRPKAESQMLRLLEMAGPLSAIGDASSHPRDLEANAKFREAVTILKSADVPISTSASRTSTPDSAIPVMSPVIQELAMNPPPPRTSARRVVFSAESP